MSFVDSLQKEFEAFMDKLSHYEDVFDFSAIDHACYRTSSEVQYKKIKSEFSQFAILLVESMVGNRLIATYKLNKPLSWGNIKIDIVEVPAPKEGRQYKDEFEHVEIVINESFNDFASKYPQFKFDFGATSKKHNPELKLGLDHGGTIKFHHQALEAVIEQEKRLNI